MYKQAIDTWDPLGDPAALLDARLQAHWALQSVAAVGAAAVPARSDDSHTSVRWLPRHRALAGGATAGKHRAALRLADLTAIVLDEQDGVVEQRRLDGETVQTTLQWFGAALERLGEPTTEALSLAEYEMPPHPTGCGERFRVSGALDDLARWFGNAANFLEAVQRRRTGASPVRCWPHHFDMATLITLDTDENEPEKARSIGVGLSPGDGSYDEPYFYVNPWPPPHPEDLPPLDGPGKWHTENWVGAVLPARDIVSAPAGEQPGRVAEHLELSLAACDRLLGCA